MLRNKKSACGISNFECKKPIFRDFSYVFTSDPTNYNIKDTLIESRKSIENFYNIPRSFQSVISSTEFIPVPYPFKLQQQVGITCTDVGNPFSEKTRYLYETEAVQGNSQYIKVRYGDSNNDAKYTKQDIFMDTYFDGSQYIQQKPGILMPTATMAPFNAIGAIAIPTSALATANKGGVTKHRSTKSGCPKGFQITAQVVSNDAYISVSPGTVSVGLTESNNDATGILNNVSNVVLEKASSNVKLTTNKRIQVDNIKKNFRCSIYAIAYLDQKAKENSNKKAGETLSWSAYLFADASIDNQSKGQYSKQFIDQISKLPLPKYRQIGNIIWNADSKTFDITSTNCSPVDLRDWVSQVGIPKAQDQNDSSVMIFGMFTDSLVKKWFKVKDC